MRPIFIIAVILLTQLTYGQTLKETRTASLVDGDYSLDGTVYLELFDDNSLNLRFGSDYLTQSNVFDVHVFLSTTNNYQRPIDTSNMLLVSNIGTESGLDYSSGARTFNLPSGVGISDYQYIVFVCIRYGRLHWGNGTFGEVTLSTYEYTEDTNTLAPEIFPNPSKDGRVEVTFKTPQENILIEVFNISGQLLSRERIIWNKKYRTELKSTGLYFFRLTSNETSVVKKIIRL
jgi:hypothetical protein